MQLATTYRQPGSGLHLDKALLPEAARRDFDFWCERIEPLLELRKGVCSRLRELAVAIDVPEKTVFRKFYAAKKGGLLALVDKRLAGPRHWKTKKQSQSIAVSDDDQQLVKFYCECNQRSSRAAVKQLRRDWVKRRPSEAMRPILGSDGIDKVRALLVKERPIDPRTGMPRGWSTDNLCRYAPTPYELKATRIGRSAAASERRLVYTTRQGLYVGSHYMFDDMWHNLEVNTFAERQAGRPLELFSHDLFSARKVRWGVRVRTRRDDGTHNQLTERMSRYTLAATLYLDGYSPRGTACIEEAGTARLSRGNIERDLYDISGGLITIVGGGMQNAKAHAGQYGALSRGNPRIKASLESSNNLTQNVFAALPGQTGKDRNSLPEEHAALMRNNENLLAARDQFIAAGEEERADQIHFLLLELNEFMRVAHALYAEIENDTEHDLEGWVESGNVTTELLLAGQWVDRSFIASGGQAELALSLIAEGKLQTRPRLLSRREVWNRGAGELIRIPGHGVCAILGDDLAEERRVDRGMFEFRDQEVGPGIHRYAAIALTAHGERLQLKDGERYQTFVNPFAPDALFVRRADGSYIGECARIARPCRAEIDAVHRACGEAAKIEAEKLIPVRSRHLIEARAKTARHTHNARVLGGKPVTPLQRLRAAQERERLRDERGTLEDLVPAQVSTAPAPSEPDADEDSLGLSALCSSETTEPDYEQDNFAR